MAGCGHSPYGMAHSAGIVTPFGRVVLGVAYRVLDGRQVAPEQRQQRDTVDFELAEVGAELVEEPDGAGLVAVVALASVSVTEA